MGKALQRLHMHSQINRGFLGAEQVLKTLIVSMLHLFFIAASREHPI
jgi:hypothetical protein